MRTGFTASLCRGERDLRLRRSRCAAPVDERAQEERERPGEVCGPDSHFERGRVAVVAAESGEELSEGGVLADKRARVPEVLDRDGEKPRCLELMCGVGQEAGGEDDEEDPRRREELTQVEAARAHEERDAEGNRDGEPDRGADAGGERS